ncbi:MAG: hypothetical protein WCF20_14710 [Methylovirgula sp.]
MNIMRASLAGIATLHAMILGAVPLGYRRGPWVRRLPAARQTHSRLDFGINDELNALRFAFNCYNIDIRGTPLSQGSFQL